MNAENIYKIQEIKLMDEESGAPPIIIVKVQDNCYLLETEYHTYYKGITGRTTSKPDDFMWQTFNGAFEQANKIFDYFRNPLPPEDVTWWLDWITEIPEQGDMTNDDYKEWLKSIKRDNKAYQKFAKLILAGNHEDALDFMKHQDTYVREGVIPRIWKEIEYPTINRK